MCQTHKTRGNICLTPCLSFVSNELHEKPQKSKPYRKSLRLNKLLTDIMHRIVARRTRNDLGLRATIVKCIKIRRNLEWLIKMLAF